MTRFNVKQDSILKEKTNKFNKAGLWPAFLHPILNTFQEPTLWLTLNMIVISQIIWPLDPIHTDQIALIFGLCYIFGAFSKLVSGIIADKYSRIKLIAITSIGSSFSFVLYGFMPEGLGTITFFYIIGISILREIFTGTETIIPSFLDDAVDEKKRSEIIGKTTMVYQTMIIISNLIAAFLFRYIWRQYFIITGLIGVIGGFIIYLKGKEPKRGSKRKELTQLLNKEGIEYNYNLNKETIQSTILSKTNFIIIIEGFFTQIILVVPYILLISYLQSPPYNFSPVIFAFFGILFGGPGIIIGSMTFSKKIDKAGEKNIANRIYFIIISLILSYTIWAIMIFIPYKELSLIEGNNFLIFISYPLHILAGLLYSLGFILIGIFSISQRPLIMKLNLPEAQGAISSINSFFEILSIGVGAIIAGVILNFFNSNYQITVLVLVIIGFFGALIWIISLKTIKQDMKRVSEILDRRKEDMSKETTSV